MSHRPRRYSTAGLGPFRRMTAPFSVITPTTRSISMRGARIARASFVMLALGFTLTACQSLYSSRAQERVLPAPVSMPIYHFSF